VTPAQAGHHAAASEIPATLNVVSDLPATSSTRADFTRPGPHAEGPPTDAASAVDRAPTRSLVTTRSSAAARLTLAVVVGLAAGALTEWSVPHLPFSLEPLGNSAAPWVLVTFAVALTARRMGESVTLAVITLLALVLGFYVVEAGRGWGVSRHQVALWSVASVAIGPLVGVAAGWLRHAGRTQAALGAGVLGGLLAGEAIWGLTGLRFSSPAEYWHVQLVLGVGLAVGLTLWRSRRHLRGSAPALVVSLAAGAVVGLATLAAYHVSP
jgi:hypothetical protein